MPKHLRPRVTDLLNAANAAARQLIADHPHAIETIAQALIERRELDAGQIADLRAQILDSARGAQNFETMRESSGMMATRDCSKDAKF